MAKATQIHTKHPSEKRNLAINCAGLLDGAEKLTGTPTFVASPGDLSFASARVNTTAATINGVSISEGRALLASVSGGTSNRQYDCTATCGTDSNPAQTVVVSFKLFVTAE